MRSLAQQRNKPAEGVMADGLTDGTSGGDEAEAREAESTLATADTTAMAVAPDIARTGPEASREAAAYLKHHAGLVAKQTQLAELRLRHFKNDRRSADKATGRKRLSDVMKNTPQALVTMAALCIAGGIAVMIYDAFTSRAVVVEAFETPPALAASGISGKVVASSVLDALQKLADVAANVGSLNAAARSTVAPATDGSVQKKMRFGYIIVLSRVKKSGYRSVT
jgi:hypothetical protein